MTEDTPTTPDIKGYVAVSADKKDIVNENKILEEIIKRRIDEIMKRDDVDKRNIALANTNIEQAFMWLNRGIFQPQRIDLEVAGE